MKSNINIRSNIYPVSLGMSHFYKALPGYILKKLKPQYFDVRNIRSSFRILPTDKQLEEQRRTLVCFLCGRPCAGLCEEKPSRRPLTQKERYQDN